MIVRILGDHRYELNDDGDLAAIEALDDKLGHAIEAEDATTVAATLANLIDRIRSSGTVVPADDFQPSDLVVPHEGSTLDEIRSLLASES